MGFQGLGAKFPLPATWSDDFGRSVHHGCLPALLAVFQAVPAGLTQAGRCSCPWFVLHTPLPRHKQLLQAALVSCPTGTAAGAVACWA